MLQLASPCVFVPLSPCNTRTGDQVLMKLNIYIYIYIYIYICIYIYMATLPENRRCFVIFSSDSNGRVA